MRKTLLLAFFLALLLALLTNPASAGNIEKGTFNFCWGWLEGYGGDTFTNDNDYKYIKHKDEIHFKCKGTIHAGATPPSEEVSLHGDRPYYYWGTNAVDWSFGFYDPLFGPATGFTEDVKITIYPDGTWTLKAKAKLN